MNVGDVVVLRGVRFDDASYLHIDAYGLKFITRGELASLCKISTNKSGITTWSEVLIRTFDDFYVRIVLCQGLRRHASEGDDIKRSPAVIDGDLNRDNFFHSLDAFDRRKIVLREAWSGWAEPVFAIDNKSGVIGIAFCSLCERTLHRLHCGVEKHTRSYAKNCQQWA